MHSIIKISALFAACLATLADAHGAIISATGDMGGQGSALGVNPATPRDGTRRRPFQQDSTIFDDQTPANAQGCGRTLEGGRITVASAMQAMLGNMGGMPLVSQGGTVSMMVHQVNADGAGPYTCMIDATGTGQSYQPMTVITQVPGRNGRDRNGETTAHPLVAQMPAGMACTGTIGANTNICMVRCQNPARAGPFGGCVPVQMVQAQAAPPVNVAPVNNFPVNNAAPINNAPVQDFNNNVPVNNVPVNTVPVNNAPVNNNFNAPVNSAPVNAVPVNSAPINNGNFVPNNAQAGNFNNGANVNQNVKRTLVAGRALRKLE